MYIWLVTNENDIADLFSEKHRLVLDDSVSQAYNSDWFTDSVPDPEISRIYFQYNIDEAINKLNSVIGWDNVHSCHLKYGGVSFRSQTAPFFSSCLRHIFIPEIMLKWPFKPFLKYNKLS